MEDYTMRKMKDNHGKSTKNINKETLELVSLTVPNLMGHRDCLETNTTAQSYNIQNLFNYSP